MNAPSPDVFISYAHQDFPLAESLCLGLEARGVRCAIAPRDIPPGEAYGAWIVRTIGAVRVVVLMFSSSSNKSTMVMREMERAASLSKPVIPVRLEDIAPTDEMAFFIGREHRLDALSRPIDRHADRLAEAVRRFTAGEAAAASRSALREPDGPSPARRTSDMARIAVGAAAVLVLAAGVGWFVRTRPGPSTVQPPGHTPASGASSAAAVPGAPAVPAPATPPAVTAPPLAHLTLAGGALAGIVLNEPERIAAVARAGGGEHPGLTVNADGLARLVRGRLVDAGFAQVRVLAKQGTNGGPSTLRVEFEKSDTHTPAAARTLIAAHVLDPEGYVSIVAD